MDILFANSSFTSLMDTMKPSIVDGAIYVVDPRDFGPKNTNGIIEIPKHELPKYNQYKNTKTKSACTIVNATKDLCYNYGIDFTDELMDDVMDYAIEKCGYVVNKGWYTSKAMEAVRKFFKTKGIDARYIRITMNDPEFEHYRDAGYMIGCAFKGNTAYVLDYAKDGYLKGIDFKPSTFGHRTSLYGKVLGKNFIWDSEYGLEYNEYQIGYLEELVKNSVYYPAMYVWILPDNLNKPMEEVKKDNEREKELAILENALSICWKHLDDINKEKAHELAEYIRGL